MKYYSLVLPKRLVITLGIMAAALTPSLQADTDLWTGAVSGAWDASTANWSNSGSGIYAEGDLVQFGDTGGTNLTIAVQGAGVSPASVNFTDNGAGANAYIFNTGAINGTGAVTLNSGFGGSVRFNVANGYTGGTAINSGTVIVGITGALGGGGVTLAGGTLQNAVGVTVSNNISVSGSGTIRLGINQNFTLNGALSGSGSLTLGGSMQLSSLYLGFASNTFTGTITIPNSTGNNQTVIRFASTTAGNAGASWVIGGAQDRGTTLDFATGTISFGSMTGSGLLQGNGAGLKTVSAGALGLNDTFSGQIANSTGTIALAKVGAGTMTLSRGAGNGYSGGTVVDNGALLITNTSNSGAGTGAVTVNAGAFGGTGIQASAVNVAGGARLQGGLTSAASGSLTINGAVSLSDNSVIQLTLGGSGAHSSLVRTGGVWVFDANQAFTLIDLGMSAGVYDNIVTGLLGSETGLATIGTWTVTNSGWAGSFSYDGAGGVDLTLSAVPEPSVLAFIALGFAGLIIVRRFHGVRSLA